MSGVIQLQYQCLNTALLEPGDVCGHFVNIVKVDLAQPIVVKDPQLESQVIVTYSRRGGEDKRTGRRGIQIGFNELNTRVGETLNILLPINERIHKHQVMCSISVRESRYHATQTGDGQQMPEGLHPEAA